MTAPKSVFEYPKEAWRLCLYSRPLDDLVNIDFPYALALGKDDPMKMLILQMINTDKDPADPLFGPDLQNHVNSFLKKSPPTKEYWMNTASLLSALVSGGGYSFNTKSVQAEAGVSNVFHAWMNGFSGAESAIKEAETAPEENTEFFDTVDRAVRSVLWTSLWRPHQAPDVTWISYFSKDFKEKIARDTFKILINTVYSSGASEISSGMSPTVSPGVEKHFPELSRIVLRTTENTIRKKLPLVKEIPKFDIVVVKDPTTLFFEEFANIFEGKITFGKVGNAFKFATKYGKMKKDLKEKEARNELIKAFLVIESFYRKNHHTVALDRWHNIFMCLAERKELCSSLGDFGQAAKVFLEKKEMFESIPSTPSRKTKPKSKM